MVVRSLFPLKYIVLLGECVLWGGEGEVGKIKILMSFITFPKNILTAGNSTGSWGVGNEWGRAWGRIRCYSCPQDVQNLRRRVLMQMRDSRIKQPTRIWKGANPIPTGRPKWHSAYFGGRRSLKSSRRKWPLIDFWKIEKISALGGRGKGMRLKGARGDSGAVVAGQRGGAGPETGKGPWWGWSSTHTETSQGSHVLEGSRGHVSNGLKTLSVKVFELILWAKRGMACRILSWAEF